MEKKSGQELLRLATRLLTENNLEEALTVFDYLITRLPDVPIPLLSRCTCLIQLERYKEALVDGERILKLPNEPVGEGIAPGCTTVHSVAYLRMAKCYKELGQNDKATEAMRKRAELEKVRVQYTKDDSEDDNLEDNKSIDNRSKAEELRLEGNRLYKTQKYQEAYEKYNKALDMDSDSLLTNSNQAQVLLKMCQYDKALIYADKCIRLDHKWPKGHYRKGCILLEQKKYREALVELETAEKFGKLDDELMKKIKEARNHSEANNRAKLITLDSRSIKATVVVLIAFFMWYFSYEIGIIGVYIFRYVERLFAVYFDDLW
ncbi:5525_t:CDS:2 [Paraglomus brasilianum]|uniref:5525_t:CDS:1 n=1 Tax=Paraglomus brasilianum TaxID=144538 RepID=A0A9N9A9T3_9GLOM|nr:5525_t:CDS:2 [Paraglomus brasilianum]